MANNRKVISVILMFGLLLCSCDTVPRLEKLSRDRHEDGYENERHYEWHYRTKDEQKIKGETRETEEKNFYDDCEKRGYKRAYNQAYNEEEKANIIHYNNNYYHRRTKRAGGRPHPDRATEEEKKKKSRNEIENDFAREGECNNCLSTGEQCPPFIKEQSTRKKFGNDVK